MNTGFKNVKNKEFSSKMVPLNAPETQGNGKNTIHARKKKKRKRKNFFSSKSRHHTPNIRRNYSNILKRWSNSKEEL
jgi:hypothetical protein